MNGRDLPHAVLLRKAEGMGFRWDGTYFRHAQLNLTLAPVPKRFTSCGPSGTDCRATFDTLVKFYNAARNTKEQAA